MLTPNLSSTAALPKRHWSLMSIPKNRGTGSEQPGGPRQRRPDPKKSGYTKRIDAAGIRMAHRFAKGYQHITGRSYQGLIPASLLASVASGSISLLTGTALLHHWYDHYSMTSVLFYTAFTALRMLPESMLSFVHFLSCNSPMSPYYPSSKVVAEHRGSNTTSTRVSKLLSFALFSAATAIPVWLDAQQPETAGKYAAFSATFVGIALTSLFAAAAQYLAISEPPKPPKKTIFNRLLDGAADLIWQDRFSPELVPVPVPKPRQR